MATTATATTGIEAVYSDTADETSGARRRIVEDLIYSQDPIDLPLRDFFGGYEKMPVKSIKIGHLEDNHMAIAGTIATAATGWNTGSDVTGLSVTDGDVYCVGDVIMTADAEIAVVADVDESGNTIDLYARGEGGSTESNSNTDGDAIYIIGNAQIEGYTYGADVRFMTRASKNNYTQIMKEVVSVSKSYEEVSAKGAMYGIKSEVKHQMKMKTLRIAKLLERCALYGVPNTGTLEGSSTAPRLMSGIIAAGTGTIDIQTETTSLSSVELTEAHIDTEMQNVFDNGGKIDTLIVNSFNKKVISGFMTPYRRANFDDTKYGGVVSTFQNDFGIVDILLNRYMLQSDVIGLAKKNFQFGALRPFKVIDLPDSADSFRQELLGEYTVMLHNEEHAFHIYSTSTS